ncbi:MAG: hypothetical protein JNG88_13470 [Phycisphaerales bacterium]|nr:hypothetical protein [Phycisphaerales bacterium]
MMNTPISRLLSALVVLCGATIAVASPVQWLNDPNEALKLAREKLLPIYFYVPASRDQEMEAENWEDGHDRTHRDPKVVAIVQERFIPLRLHRAGQNDWFLEKLGVNKQRGWTGGIASPDLELLESLDAEHFLEPRHLIPKLTSGFRKFRRELYENQLQPIIISPSAKPAALKAALNRIGAYYIDRATDDLVAMAKRELSEATRKELYDAMAVLSTQKCAADLLERSASDDAALQALGKCQTRAASVIAGGMNTSYDKRHIAVYDALCDVIKAKGKKSTAFWKTARPDAKAVETKRVTELAEKAAAKWEAELGPVR